MSSTERPKTVQHWDILQDEDLSETELPTMALWGADRGDRDIIPPLTTKRR